MASTTGRRVVELLTNKSGGALAAGDVVVIDTGNNEAVTTSTAGGVTGTIGIAQEAIASNAAGRILTAGYAALVNVNASVTRGNFGKTHTVAKQATDAGGSRAAGAFCQFLTGGTTPTAHVFGLADASTSSSGVPSGTSFPGSPADGDLYFRTDLDLLCRYRSSGTRWVTVQLMSSEIAMQPAVIPLSANNSFYGVLPNVSGDLWLEKIETSTQISATNNGTNYWTFASSKIASGTSLGSFNTSADTAATSTRHTITVNALSGTSDVAWQMSMTKTLSPGTAYLFGATLFYRRVIT